MKSIWIAFFCGLFIGANIGIFVAALIRMAGDCDRLMAEIKDVDVQG